MATYHGSTVVKSGYYWNPKGWAVSAIPKEGGILPGGSDTHYVRMPTLLVFAVIPLIGALFVFFLPFIGFALTIVAIARKLAGGVRKEAEGLASTMAPGWQPGEAHFTGKKAEGGEGAKAAPDAKLDALAKEIEEKKGK